MTRRFERVLVCAAVVCGIAGCATAPVDHDGMSFLERQEALQQFDGWDVRGRIAIDTGDEAFQGRFQWRESGAGLELSIRGPLGAGVLQVSGPPDRLTVRARGDTWELDDPETELSALLGWWLPVRSLSAWLLGLPDPLFPAVTSVGPGDALQSLEQRLWRLTYQSYQVAEGVLLPRRIDLVHRHLELRVVIDEWQGVAAE